MRQSPVHLRPARHEDIASMAEIERDLFGPSAWSASQIREELKGVSRHYVVAVEDGQGGGEVVVGFGGVFLGDVADIMTIDVVEGRQRLGIGRLIMDDLLAQARAIHCPAAMLEVRADNEGAIALYMSLGFLPIGRRRGYYPPDGADALTMRLALDSPSTP